MLELLEDIIFWIADCVRRLFRIPLTNTERRHRQYLNGNMSDLLDEADAIAEQSAARLERRRQRLLEEAKRDSDHAIELNRIQLQKNAQIDQDRRDAETYGARKNHPRVSSPTKSMTTRYLN